jgi:FlaA1/EpsC-like NDP-sugar epimerase
MGTTTQAPIVLVGTVQTVSALARSMSVTPGTPDVLGCVLLGKAPTFAGAWPDLAILGTFDSADQLTPFAPTLLDAHPHTSAVVTLPAEMRSEQARVRAILAGAGVGVKIVPPLVDLLRGEGLRHVAAPRPRLDFADLIGRVPYELDRAAVREMIEGRRVLITGAGGSIGSEIARLCAGFGPERLILMERGENALFEIDRQIARRSPGVTRRALLHDVTDAEATRRALEAERPDVVFHAAAHKHVPLMEDHPAHAVTNNLLGTKSIADASVAAGVSRFVMISSDKAVNPTSVMGATKRVAELYVQWLHRQNLGGRTKMSMVRFGNVLGSACSVLPIWEAQIADGGPVTVTDPRMTRYFMTIHEAATLVIQSATIPADEHAAVYVLDMGEPVRIAELAERLVRAHGYRPVFDGAASEEPLDDLPTMEIAITGARPGEKLHEELAYAAENLTPTPYAGIRSWKGRLSSAFDGRAMIEDLSAVRASMEPALVVEAIRHWVPEMVRPGVRTSPRADGPATAVRAA